MLVTFDAVLHKQRRTGSRAKAQDAKRYRVSRVFFAPWRAFAREPVRHSSTFCAKQFNASN
jgi:hypothetical protein